MITTESLRRPARERRFVIVWLLARVLVATLALAGTAAAQAVDLADASLEQLLGLEVVTASRTTERILDAPARVQVITEDQIRRRGYRSLVDVLKDLSDFKVDIGGDTDYPYEVTVQGSRGASRIIVLLDGIRISSPTNEPLPILANYPVHSARQIEILYGPASAIYGADAFSGVINIISRSADEEAGLQVGSWVGQHGLQSYSGSYAGRIGNSGTYLVAGQFFHDEQPDLSRYYPVDFQGLQGQRTGTFNTIFGQKRAVGMVSPDYDVPIQTHSAQAQLRVGGWQLSLFENQSRTPTASAYSPDNVVFNDAAFNLNRLIVGAGSFTRQIGRVTSTSTVTMSRHELDPESGSWNVFSNMQKSFKYAYGSMVKGEQQLAWKPTATTNLTTGATAERFHSIPQGADLNAPIQSRNTPGTILGTDITDDFNTLRYSNVGAYLELRQTITERVSATVGGRIDRNSRFGATFNPRLGVVMKPGNASTLKVLYGSAYLAPSPYQAYAHYGSFYSFDGGQTYQSDYWHVPNPDLKPQRKKTYEVQVLQNVTPQVGLSVSSFYSRVSDRIQEYDPDQGRSGFFKGWPVSYMDFGVNEGRETTYGTTLALDIAGSFVSTIRVNALASLSVVGGRSHNEGTRSSIEVGSIVPVQARFGVDVRGNAWALSPRVTLSGPQRLRAIQAPPKWTSRERLDGYTTMDLTARKSDVIKEMDVFVTVENMFDARYRHINTRAYLNPEELIGAPQNPRRVSVGIQIQVR
jgi:outer membrane receptor for ferrienterochelin and colicin